MHPPVPLIQYEFGYPQIVLPIASLARAISADTPVSLENTCFQYDGQILMDVHDPSNNEPFDPLLCNDDFLFCINKEVSRVYPAPIYDPGLHLVTENIQIYFFCGQGDIVIGDTEKTLDVSLIFTGVNHARNDDWTDHAIQYLLKKYQSHIYHKMAPILEAELSQSPPWRLIEQMGIPRPVLEETTLLSFCKNCRAM